ncbi:MULTISPECIES: penicillin-binding protein 1C [Rhodanobacter]|uniref:penicillin-binding protein 1C n=1 Tax=Rhodanobacter TaxID=75309 RepID=UPI00090FDFE8|nr:penicillin-binding protein 1C [Rhodanobacter thiooxydans]TAN17860.1 MAG: penicillin-binding protein 1C [Rhodanobacter sp.]UJJ54992.1 penicillin-binding protein 1C [Rhodanobacter thiooxydans]
MTATSSAPLLPAPCRSRTWRWLRGIVIATIALLLAAFALDRLFPLHLPAPDTGSTVVLARDGTPLRAFADSDGVWRYPTTAKQVSPLYLQALLNYEDRWFYRHPGVNPYALLRGLGGGLRHGRIVSGGSTLSMQVARIIQPIPHTFRGKLVQILRALQLEAHLSKAQILDLYLNHAPFGGPIEGVEAASWAYLGKPAARLSHAEAALLAVLPQSPSRLRPDRHAQAARAARDKVLGRMRDLGVWSVAEVHGAAIEPVAARSLRAPLSAALLAERLHREQPAARRITSTIDANLQRAAEERVGAYLSRLPAHTSAALLVVDNATLEARVYVGTSEYADPQRHGYVDMVRAPRSPGSTLKPFLYGLALDDGLIHSQSLLVDAPQDFGGYKPGNFDEAFSGPVSAAEALQRSLNVPAVDVLDRVGPGRFVARLANGGIDLGLPDGATPNLSIILGGASTRLENLVGAYTAFANGGIAGTPRYTTEQPARPRRLLSPGAAWIIRDVLAHNPADVEGAPLAGAINRHERVAWKTGTSYGYRDAWSLGVTDRWTVGVWIGRPDGTPSPGQYGAVTALPLLFQIVDMLPQRDASAPARPASVTSVAICWPLGGTLAATDPALCRQHRTAWVLDGALPPTFAERGLDAWSAGLLTLRVNDQGQRLSGACHARRERTIRLARWPALATPWLGVDDRARSALPPLAPGCAADALNRASPIRISGLIDGVTLRRAPNSDKPLRVTLRALGAQAGVQWLLNGRLQGSSEADAAIAITLPQAGDYRITAVARDGAFATLTLRVVGPPA